MSRSLVRRRCWDWRLVFRLGRRSISWVLGGLVLARGEEGQGLALEWAGLPLQEKPLAAPLQAGVLQEAEWVQEMGSAQGWEDPLRARRFLRYSDLRWP